MRPDRCKALKNATRSLKADSFFWASRDCLPSQTGDLNQASYPPLLPETSMGPVTPVSAPFGQTQPAFVFSGRDTRTVIARAAFNVT